MTLTITYTLVPFLRSVGGKLHPGVPRHSTTRETALADAEHLAPFYAGVMVLKQRADVGKGAFLEPIPICVVGEVPGDLLTQLGSRTVSHSQVARCLSREHRAGTARPLECALEQAFDQPLGVEADAVG